MAKMTITEMVKRAGETQSESQEITIKRLKGEVVLKPLSYDEIAEIRRKENEDVDLYVCLYGIAEPDLQTEEFTKAMNVLTPAQALKSLLTPGEIQDISRRIQKLSGYYKMTIEDIKKK